MVPVVKSVKMNAKTSLKPHCHSPYSLEANKKSKLKFDEYGIKSNSKKATSVMLTDCPVWLLISSRSISLFVLSWLLKLSPVYVPWELRAIPLLIIIPSSIGKDELLLLK